MDRAAGGDTLLSRGPDGRGGRQGRVRAQLGHVAHDGGDRPVQATDFRAPPVRKQPRRESEARTY